MWPNETLEATMDVVEKWHVIFKCLAGHGTFPWAWSLFSHLNVKTRFKKMGIGGVLTKEEDDVMIAWTLTMQECILPISLQ
jgi:hypothetical protein